MKVCTPKEFNEIVDNLSKCNIVFNKDIEKDCKGKNCKYTHTLKDNYSIILMPKLIHIIWYYD